ncbi:MAG TPA: methyltransferase dimerization domain-containing protein [Bryobacteraceae bacterium]|nr:methyltransferase dimerization domain-containing protein [Bryobacteraceae bacterium]
MIPDALLQTLRGFQDSRVLLTGLELDVFSAIDQGATATAVAERINADARATEMLLNALVALGVLEKEGGSFRNTPAATEHFTASTDRLAMMHHVNLWTRWSNLTDAVRAGTAPVREPMETRPTEWTEAFIAAMDFNARGRAPEVVKAVGAAGVRRMLDVGGGSGAYSIAFA